MLIEKVSIRDLAGALAPRMSLPAWPGLATPDDRARLLKAAKRSPVWRRLDGLDPKAPIPILRRSLFRDYARTGERDGYQAAFFSRTELTTDAAYALFLNHPKADLDLLQDLLWHWCEMASWIIPAHEHIGPDLRRNLELASTRVGAMLAQILRLVGDRLEPEVRERLGREIDQRMLEPAHDYRLVHWWATCDMNWNHVCNANLISTALDRIADPGQLAKFIHPIIQRLDYALDGFAADGGCLEGPGYWEYGFGHFLRAAVAMHYRTGGVINLMADSRVEPICRYPLASYLNPPLRTCFADGGHGYLSPSCPLMINRFLPIPELLGLTPPTSDGLLSISDWSTLALYQGERHPGVPELSDVVLPVLGQARVSVGRGSARVTLAALAGRNDVPHNHNDIGSFILSKAGLCPLTDPGAPKYTAKTFSAQRYEIIFCRSLGHSVPIINGHEQQAGGQFVGTIAVDHLDPATPRTASADADVPKVVRIDMSKAYPDPTLRSLRRTFALSSSGRLRLEDAFAFSRPPRSLEESFITFEKAKVDRSGRGVTIGQGASRTRLTADKATPGRFRIEERPESVTEGREGKLLRRVVFTPARRKGDMLLAFEIA